jgi:pimeloyl-ACP methyl ester carboxylesterase
MRTLSVRRLVVRALLVVGLVASGFAAARPAVAAGGCTDRADSVIPTQDKLGLSGLFARPAKAPSQLVVFDHGYGKPATVYWAGHLKETAQHGALAVALDYRGQQLVPPYRGWNVYEGAEDSIAAAKYFLAACPSIEQVILMGVSMGGNTSGLAVAADATRADGSPLFDYWIDVEGVANVTETYLEATAVSPFNAFAARAKEDIENDFGGTLAEQPDRYREATIVSRGDDLGASGIKGVTLVHGLDDGLVPYNQSRELESVLAAQGIPTDFFTVATKGSGESGTTLSGNVLGPDGSPFAGHGAEESTTQLVIKTGFDRLWALMAGKTPGPHREFLVDGDTNAVAPTP